MDRVTKNYIQDFLKTYEIDIEADSKNFEKFCTYCAVKKYYSSTIQISDLDDIVVGSSGDTGIDGLAIIAENKLITEIEEIDDLVTERNQIDVLFLFVQAKDTNKFNRQQFTDFTNGVLELVEDHLGFDPSRLRNKKLKSKADLILKIFAEYAIKLKNNPVCKLYYIISDFQPDISSISRQQLLIDKEKKRLEATNLFSKVEITIEGTNYIQKLYKNTLSRPKVTIEFPNKTSLPKINGIDEAYIGVLSFLEFKKIILDDSGNIRTSIFEDNVRYFNKDFSVNSDIQNTIKSGQIDRFAVLNNGITIVTKKLRVTGNALILDDYQIVNGCQTSHILSQSNNMEGIENLYVTVKIINTNDIDIINNIIKATNNQTKVSGEALLSLVKFNRSLEDFYNTFRVTGREGNEENRLYYERQEGQYINVTQTKIISIKDQAKCFAAMFLDVPHDSVRSYRKIKQKIDNSLIFCDQHHLLPYYTSALAHYEVQKLLRNKKYTLTKYNKLRFQIVMALKYLIVGFDIPSISDAKINDCCYKINKIFDKQQELLKCIKVIISIINEIPVLDLDNPDISVKAYITEDIIKGLKEKRINSTGFQEK